MADGRCADHFFVEKLLHEFVDFRGVKKQCLPGIRGKTEGVLAGQQHAWQQGPFVEKAVHMVIIAVSLKCWTG